MPIHRRLGVLANATEHYQLHELLGQLNYRRQNRTTPYRITKQATHRHIFDPDQHELHYYRHSEPISQAAHRTVHEHLMAQGYKYSRASDSPTHYYRKGATTEVKIAPHSAGGHYVRIMHPKYYGKQRLEN